MELSFPSGQEVIQMPFQYYKREGCRFYFRNDKMKFDVMLQGKDLYHFVDAFDLYDDIEFELPRPTY